MPQDESILILSGPLQGRRVPIAQHLSIGRSPESDLRLADIQTSRMHAVIERTPAGTIIRDIGSNNGTFVGEHSIDECLLSNGDIIQVGQTRFRFERGAAPPQSLPRRTEASSVRFEQAAGDALHTSSVDKVYKRFFETPSHDSTVEKLRTAQDRLAAVYRANQIISSERDLKSLFHQVMEQIFSLIPAHNGIILLKEEESGELITEYIEAKAEDAEMVISSTIVERAIDDREAVMMRDSALESGSSILGQSISSAMCAPLLHHDEVLGVLYVDTRGTSVAFAEGDLELLVALSGPTAIAIKNAQYTEMRERYVQMLERSYDDTLILLANAVELRDHYTIGHNWRVSNYAGAMAKKLGWNKEKVKQAQMGGVLHDIGKIAIDDAILRKPAQLTDDEYEKMKVHPERGARMLEDVAFLQPIIPYCLYHHERYDGTGYPFGLGREQIPIEGRLMAVADSFDAMTSHRPHCRGTDAEIAIRAIDRGKGTQFDPLCAEALIACFREGRISQILQHYAKDEQSIACPFCSTFIRIPEGTDVGNTFHCQVCHRLVRLQQRNEAFFGELVAELSSNRENSPQAGRTT